MTLGSCTARTSMADLPPVMLEMEYSVLCILHRYSTNKLNAQYLDFQVSASLYSLSLALNSLCIPGWLGTHNPLKCWDYK